MASDPSHEPLVLIDPTAESETVCLMPARRLPSLRNATIVVVNALNDPDRSNCATILQSIISILSAAGARDVTTIRKHPSALDMEAGLLGQLASDSNGVVIIEGD